LRFQPDPDFQGRWFSELFLYLYPTATLSEVAGEGAVPAQGWKGPWKQFMKYFGRIPGSKWVGRTIADITENLRRQQIMKNWDRITVEPGLMNGQPCVRGMRLTVRRVLEALRVYPDWNDLLREYPELEPDDIRQCLDFAAQSLEAETYSLDAV
jgi:uncharacterized protein (DUF433 family)